jgi:hypothetical protein
VYSLCAGGKDCIANGGARLVPFLLKILANISDEMFVILSKKWVSFGIGVAIGAAIEVGLCIYEIKKAFDQKESGAISHDQFKAKLVQIIAKAILRLGLGAAGSAIGLACGSIPGSFVGGFIGGLSGHFLGYLIGWCYENRDYLDG